MQQITPSYFIKNLLVHSILPNKFLTDIDLYFLLDENQRESSFGLNRLTQVEIEINNLDNQTNIFDLIDSELNSFPTSIQYYGRILLEYINNKNNTTKELDYITDCFIYNMLFYHYAYKINDFRKYYRISNVFIPNSNEILRSNGDYLNFINHWISLLHRDRPLTNRIICDIQN